MSKWASDGFLRAPLDWFAAHVTRCLLLPARVTTISEAETLALAERAIAGVNVFKSGAAWVAQVDGGQFNVTTSGAATHLAFCSATEVLYVTNLNSPPVVVNASDVAQSLPFSITMEQPL